MNLPHDSITTSCQILYCFGLLTSFPVQALPAFEINESTSWFNKIKFSNIEFQYLKNIILRTVTVLFIGMLATIVPKFGLFVNLLGSLACTALAYIIPIFLYNKMCEDLVSIWRRRIHYLLIVFGFACGIVSFVMTLLDIIAAFKLDYEDEIHLSAAQ